MNMLTPCCAMLILAAGLVLARGAQAATTIPCDRSDFGLSPYVWKCSGKAEQARAEATMPGAYFKTIVKDTGSVGVVIDGTANEDCPVGSMPVVEYSIDGGPFTHIQLTQTGCTYTLPVSGQLDASVPHRVEFYFRAADLMLNRWTASTTHLRIAGISLDDGGSIAAYPKRSKLAIGFGDSITEGVGVEALFTSWSILEPNNARCSWFPIVCSALDCEYGLLGTGGQGMVRVMQLPSLNKSWDHYDAQTSRLKNGLLLPEPDYVFCNMGTNDYGGLDVTSNYLEWATAVRKACPNAQIFCVLPGSGSHRDEIASVVAARRNAKDQRVYLIDVPSLNATITQNGGATQHTYDGVHPSMYGQALFGANIAVKVSEIISRQR